MADLGNISLYAMLITATLAGALAAVGASRGDQALVRAAILLAKGAALFASMALLILLYAFAVSDFSLTYVQHYSDRPMPMFYKLTAVWGGQEGSLLVWAWLLAIVCSSTIYHCRRLLPEMLPTVTVILMVLLDFFTVMLIVASNPFETFLVNIPPEGTGLNPLLQNPYMVTHPPALYLGYVGMAVPFALAIAALITGRTDERWLAVARPWTIISWFSLSLGLVLGMLWAYEELGWGGYWAWDPVENAGLIPWFTATALLHSLLAQRRRKMFKLWNAVLAVLSFELTIFGTFTTRSGFIQSVHAFAQSNISWYLVGFMSAVLIFSAGLIFYRRRLLTSPRRLEAMLSREFALQLGNWLLLATSLLVLFLTVLPTLSQLGGTKISINSMAFNRWIGPLGLSLLALKGFAPLISWRRTQFSSIWRPLTLSVGSGLLLIIGLLVVGLRGFWPLITFALCAFVACSTIGDSIRLVRRANLSAIWQVGRRRRLGAYLIHGGVVLFFIGFAGASFKTEQEVSLRQGERTTVGRYELRFDGMRHARDAQKEELFAELSIYQDGQRRGVIKPARHLFFKHPDQPASEVDLRRSLREDLFVVLGEFNEEAQTASFKIIINPLVNWIWLGFFLFIAGTLLIIVQSPKSPKKLKFSSALLRGWPAFILPLIFGAGAMILKLANGPWELCDILLGLGGLSLGLALNSLWSAAATSIALVSQADQNSRDQQALEEFEQAVKAELAFEIATQRLAESDIEENK